MLNLDNISHNCCPWLKNVSLTWPKVIFYKVQVKVYTYPKPCLWYNSSLPCWLLITFHTNIWWPWLRVIIAKVKVYTWQKFVYGPLSFTDDLDWDDTSHNCCPWHRGCCCGVFCPVRTCLVKCDIILRRGKTKFASVIWHNLHVCLRIIQPQTCYPPHFSTGLMIWSQIIMKDQNPQKSWTIHSIIDIMQRREKLSVHDWIYPSDDRINKNRAKCKFCGHWFKCWIWLGYRKKKQAVHANVICCNLFTLVSEWNTLGSTIFSHYKGSAGWDKQTLKYVTVIHMIDAF